MKSEHRHELQTNELGKVTEKLGSFLEVHGNRLMIGICVASLAASIVIYWARTKSNDEAAAWRELSTAFANNDADDFYDVWKSHTGTPTGLWARCHEGESWLGKGVEELFRNVELGTQHLKKARDAFQVVVDDRHAPAELRERALIGLGRTLESLSETGEAIKAYEMLVKDFPKSLYKDDAAERIEVLQRTSGQEFYAWFAKYERPKVTEKLPRDRFGEGPSLDDEEASFPGNVERLKTDDESRGRESSADDGAAPKLPGDADKPESEAKDSDPDASSKPDGVKAKSDAESKPDADGKPRPESKPDES